MYFTQTPPCGGGPRTGLLNHPRPLPDIEEDEPLQEVLTQISQSVLYLRILAGVLK